MFQPNLIRGCTAHLHKVVGATVCLFLASCTQVVEAPSENAAQSTSGQASKTVSTDVQIRTDGTIETEYGVFAEGQILVVGGKNFYVSKLGLLPVDSDNGGTVRVDQQFAPAQNSTPTTSANTQFVMLAFDGSRSLSMWQKTRDFARQNNISFTYFVSGVYFLNESIKTKYKGPGFKAGVSHIGWAKTGAEVGERLQQLNAALDEGHEIASHANGHFDGSKWTQNQWRSELRQFQSIMENAYTNNGLSEPFDWRGKVKNRMFKGFRAPLLGVSSGMRPALREFGYTYDTSKTARQSYQPQKIGGIYNFPLGHVKTTRGRVNTLSMDYNFYIAQSKGTPQLSRGRAFEDEMFETYMNYFNNNYKGSRAPVDIGHHFSLWNGGAYWRAMKRFARAVCGKPDVRCGTYSELQQHLDTQSIKVASR